MKRIKIENHCIGADDRCFIVAEVAQNHDGSLGSAHAYIDAVAETGADAIKFQTHIASEESTYDEPFRVKFSQQDKTRYDYWKRMEFTFDNWLGLAEHAKEKGLVFLSSPFSVAAVRLLSQVGMPAWKVGSGEVFNTSILKAMAETGAPILLSTGMSYYREIKSAVAAIENAGLDYAVFQCTSCYPVPFEKVGLNVIDELRHRFQCPIGYSDHSGSIFPGLAALARNVDLLEVHVTLSKKSFGPDVQVSITIDELSMVVSARDVFKRIDDNPVDKDMMAGEMSEMRKMFSKSIAPKFP